MLSGLITKVVGWAVAIFYDVERTGPGLVPGPVLDTANHPNALVDPLVIFHTGGRSSRPMARAPLFEQVFVGTVLRGLGGLPVYRREDDAGRMHLNQGTFDAAIGALRRGEAVQIFPEGTSHSYPAMVELRSGAARIALMTEERADWGLGLRIQPVGLTYERKHLFRGRAVAAYGPPIVVAGYRDAYEKDPRGTTRALTADIRRALLEVTLNFESTEDQELIDFAERIWAREAGTAPRDRASLAERLPRIQRFARGYARLLAENPERAGSLRRRVRHYRSLATLLGASERDVPRRYRPGPVLVRGAVQGLLLALVLPAALVGAVVWVIPYITTRVMAARFRPKLDQMATYKVSVGCLAFPTWMSILGVAAWMVVGWLGVLAVVIGTPLVGFATIAWKAREARVREDVRVFLRARGRGDVRERLARIRSELVDELRDVAAGWEAGPPPAGGARD